jgi:UDP-N-acetyl-D-glucosamine dehydrogenase
MSAVRPLRVVVAGQGYVGLPLAMRAVAVGHDVVGFDVSVERVKRLAAGESFVEDISSETVAAALASGRYQVTDTAVGCEGFDVAVICVPTPLDEERPDLTKVESAAVALAPYLRPGALVVLESTSYPGTTESLLVPCLEAGSGLRAGADFCVGYSPERIDPGNTEWTIETTPKLVSGIDARSLDRTDAFYGTLVAETVRVDSTGAAEMAKLLENTFRHVNIALVNELAMVAADLDIDVWKVIDAAATKPFGFMKFTPGPGVGGHCLPIDPSYLSWTVRRRLHRAFRFVELANDINEHMPDYVHARLVQALNRRGLAMTGARVLVMGLAYKRNSSDARESPATELVKDLLVGGARVTVVDPLVVEDVLPGVDVRRDLPEPEELSSQDAVVLVTDHDSFDYDAVLEHSGYVLDTRHRLEGPRVEHL